MERCTNCGKYPFCNNCNNPQGNCGKWVKREMKLDEYDGINYKFKEVRRWEK